MSDTATEERPAPERPTNEVQAEAAMQHGMTTARRLIRGRKHEEAMDALLTSVREAQMWLDGSHPVVPKSA